MATDRQTRKTLRDLPLTTERKVGCWVCGAKSDIAITVQARGVSKETHSDNTSQTRSFCADHAPAIWGDIMTALKPADGSPGMDQNR